MEINIVADVALLTRIRVENFKRFAQLDLDLHRFNLLVGPNNCGKSTLLQACSLFDFCYRASLDRERNGELRFANRTFGPEEFAVLPAANPLDLWHQRKAQKANDAIPITLQANLQSGQCFKFEVMLRFNRFTIQSATTNPPPVPPERFSITFIPGFTGLWAKEEKRTPAAVRSLQAEGQYGIVIRNLLLGLKNDQEAWKAFRQLLSTVFPTILLNEPMFDEDVDRYIRSTYDEGFAASRRDRKPKPLQFDLFSAGSGFHQFVQIFAGVYSTRATTVLLDEPDAHLFSKLQARLYDVLKGLVDQGRQIIAASHSPELIAATDPRSIVSFANGAPRRLEIRSEAAGAARKLGALENLGLLLIDAYHRVVVVEDHSDEDYVRWWMERLLSPDRWRMAQDRIVFLHAHGRPTGNQVNLMLDTIKDAFSRERNLEVRAFVLADRDYRFDEELAAEMTRLSGEAFRRLHWHVWERAEIENYLLLPDALVRVVQHQFQQGPLYRPTADEILAEFDGALESSREPTRKRLVDAFGRLARDNRHNWQPSTLVERAESFLESHWRDHERLDWCDAKDVVLPALRDRLHQRWGVSLSERELIREVQPTELGSNLPKVVADLGRFLVPESDA